MFLFVRPKLPGCPVLPGRGWTLVEHCRIRGVIDIIILPPNLYWRHRFGGGCVGWDDH